MASPALMSSVNLTATQGAVINLLTTTIQTKAGVYSVAFDKKFRGVEGKTTTSGSRSPATIASA